MNAVEHVNEYMKRFRLVIYLNKLYKCNNSPAILFVIAALTTHKWSSKDALNFIETLAVESIDFSSIPDRSF